MLKRSLKRYLPSPKAVREDRTLRRVFGTLLHNPNLWLLNRTSVTRAVAVGLLMAFVPVPFQMVLAAGGAIWFGCNLPVAVAMVWITNPVTMGPIFYFCYVVGVAILGETAQEVSFEISWEWLTHQLGSIWEPFLLGCFVVGVIASAVGSLTLNALWRLQVIRSWRARRTRRSGTSTRDNPRGSQD